MEDDYYFLKIENNTLITYPPFEHQRMEGFSTISFPAEHVNTFLEANDIIPTYIDPNYVYGYFDEVNGNWTGMIGHVKGLIKMTNNTMLKFCRLTQTKQEWQLACLHFLKKDALLQIVLQCNILHSISIQSIQKEFPQNGT